MSYHRKILSNHIARETQLLAEEKWIIDALNKIKSQRNSLQIERLNLESIKSQLKNEKRPPDSQVSEAAAAAAAAAVTAAWGLDARCNVEELDLAVTHPVLSSQKIGSLSAEEDDEDEDEMDEDEVMLDINMLMDAAHNN